MVLGSGREVRELFLRGSRYRVTRGMGTHHTYLVRGKECAAAWTGTYATSKDDLEK